MTLRIGSLCSGAGGLDMAVEKVFDARTVWHCEVDPAASKVLAHRYPGVPNYGDLKNVTWGVWKAHNIDILTAGWPCQPFSLAGKQKGADDERAIWPQIERAIRILRPRFVVLENVAAVLRSPEFSRVASALAALGYDIRWTCLRAADVGAPHRRERLFIVAHTPGDRWDEGWTEPAGLVGGSNAPLGSSQDVELLPTPSAADGGGGHISRSGARSNELLLPGIARAYASGDLLPTPAAADGERGPDFARADRIGSGGDDLVTLCARADRGRGSRWGKYADALAQWESVFSPAPPPTQVGSRGGRSLNPAFSEWMMGWPAGHVTACPGISRNDQLRIIGNGVVPQQAEAALRWLLSIAQVAA